MKEMVEQQQLTVLISYLMEKLGVDTIRISQKELKAVRNNEKYCGIKVEKDSEDSDYIVLERIKVKDVKLEDLLRDLGKKLDRISRED